MGNNTTNFSLYKPDKGEDDWATEVNNNFDTIDTNLTDERIEDVVDALLSAGASITLTYDDANDTLTVAVDETTISHDNLSNYVASEHIDHSTTNINAGTLLTGGGSIDSDITLNVDEGAISHDGIDQTTVDSDDHHAKYTDEEAQDTVASALSGGSQVTISYNDANDAINVTIDAPTQSEFDNHSSRHESGGADAVNHDNLSGFVSNEHIDHSGVTISAGKGLTGGGDITTNRTIDAHDVTTQSSNYTASENDIVLTDASGGDITVTLPSPSESVMLTVKKIDSSSNTVTVATPNTETIDGNNTFVIGNQYDAFEFTSDGSNYYII